MKINKKEKILILVLVFVLIVGIFLMYGIIPKSNELKEKQAECDKLQLEVNKLIRNYNSHDPAKKVNEIDELLMSYYLDESEVYSFVRDIDINKDNKEEYTKDYIVSDFKPIYNAIIDDLYGYNVNNKNTISTRNVEKKREPIKTHMDEIYYTIYEISADISFAVNNTDEVSTVIDKLSKSVEYQMRDFNVTVDVNAEFKLKGSVTISKFYIGIPDNIPLPLADDFDLNDSNDAPIPFVNADTKNLTFDIIPNAKYYEIYEVISTVDESGTKVFKKFSDKPVVSGLKPKENSNDVEFNYKGKLSPDKQYVVTAVGNYKDYLFKDAPNGEKVYYRTILSENLAENRKFSVN